MGSMGSRWVWELRWVVDSEMGVCEGNEKEQSLFKVNKHVYYQRPMRTLSSIS